MGFYTPDDQSGLELQAQYRNGKKALALYNAWFDSATATELEELKAGKEPESYKWMKQAFLMLNGWEGPTE
jgi:hypothetical protein